MHPTADTLLVINSKGAARRVMPGVRSPERGGLILWRFHPAAVERPNSGMHPTADTEAVINSAGVARRVMPALGGFL